MPAGRIGKQVQDLRGTAAVMAEFRFKYATVPCMGRRDRNDDARAGRPALLFESLPVPPGRTAVGTWRGPRGGRTKRLRGKTMVHRVLACFVFVRAFDGLQFRFSPWHSDENTYVFLRQPGAARGRR